MQKQSDTQFPSGFFWGASTSAHQVEGGTTNDWSEWEKINSKCKVQSAKLRKFPDYILQRYPNPLQKENYISGRACDHYNRYEEDFDIAKFLGHNAHRFSIEWSRIEPEEGTFDEKETEHYQRMIQALRARGMEPFVTVWHFTLPLWLSDKGGVLANGFPFFFERFVSRMVHVFPEVRYWITMNEPEIYACNGYYRGVWPPQQKSFVSAFRVMNILQSTHRRVYTVIKKELKNREIGVAVNQPYFESAGGVVNNALAGGSERLWNGWFLRHVENKTDFIGLNYYFHNRINYGFNKNRNKQVSDMGWELYPEGIYHVLCNLKKYGKPIYVTENGIADARDILRGGFVKETICHTLHAIRSGIPVHGYFYWSLLDNFEWDKGFWPRFGLVEVDYKTMKRRVRKSAAFMIPH